MTYGTTKIAAALGCTTTTVAKWIDRGILPGWRQAGRGDRRVRRSDLIAYMERKGIPLSQLDELPAMARESLLARIDDLTERVTALERRQP